MDGFTPGKLSSGLPGNVYKRTRAAPRAADRTRDDIAVDCSGFVHHGKLNALSQYNHLIFAPSLVDEKECIERMVRSTPVTLRCAAATVSTCCSNLWVCARSRVCARSQ